MENNWLNIVIHFGYRQTAKFIIIIKAVVTPKCNPSIK